MIIRRWLALGLAPIVVAALTGCGGNHSASSSAASASTPAPAARPSDFPTAAVQSSLGAQLTKQADGVYEASMPRDDLHFSRHSVRVAPSLDQDTELDFMVQPNGQALVMGELAATEPEEVKLVPALLRAGIDVAGVHNHITDLTPEMEWVHISVIGDPVSIAKKIHKALQTTTGTRFPVKEGKKTTTLPTKQLASMLGGEATVEDGVVQIAVDRGDHISMNGMTLPSEMGVGAIVYVEPLSGGRAATTGEICVIGSEVNAVMAALAQHGLSVTALHNHMIDTSPATFFVHWFGVGSPTTLVAGVRAALDRANYHKAG